MPDQKRKKLIEYAEKQIEKDGYVVCVCGQMFHAAEPYAEHVAACEHVERGEAAAQGHGDFTKD